MRGELDRTVDEIVVLDESADESNDKDRRRVGATGGDAARTLSWDKKG